MNLVGTYGSLRLGHYNYKSFKRMYPDLTYLGTTKINGWKLYSFGSYPGAVRTNNNEDKIIIDVFSCLDFCKSDMDDMEIGAGYEVVQIPVIINDKEIIIDIYEYPDAKEYGDLVESGDWSEYKNIYANETV